MGPVYAVEDLKGGGAYVFGAASDCSRGCVCVQYQLAVQAALLDRVPQEQPAASPTVRPRRRDRGNEAVIANYSPIRANPVLLLPCRLC